jgi:hypothetical protein
MFEGGGFAALMGGEPYYDLITTTPITGIGQYQDKNIFLNGEIGKIGNLRILVSPFAKVFGGAGADNGTGAAATTLANVETALQKVITVASATSLQYGQFITIGTEETGSTFYSMNERVKYVSESGADITIVGQGSNGGLKYEHASGEYATPIVFTLSSLVGRSPLRKYSLLMLESTGRLLDRNHPVCLTSSSVSVGNGTAHTGVLQRTGCIV